MHPGLQARSKVLGILRSNTVAPIKIAALFEEHLPVLSKDQDEFVSSLMEKEPPMSLEDFEDLLQDLETALAAA